MNKSRRMVALQASAFAAMGGATIVLDPRGTGDSGGEFAAATWAGWRADVSTAWHWARGIADERVPWLLWGHRLGALLACDVLARAAIVPSALLLWQPVTAGERFFDQFLRVASLQEVAGSGAARSRESLRARLAAGATIDIGGYDLAPALVSGAEAVDLGRLPPPACPVIWRETAPGDTPVAGPASNKVVSSWQAVGHPVDLAAVRGPSFWVSLEIEEAPALVASTCDAVSRLVGRFPPTS
jgi:exosortase A-associated hydrolase 2